VVREIYCACKNGSTGAEAQLHLEGLYAALKRRSSTVLHSFLSVPRSSAVQFSTNHGANEFVPFSICFGARVECLPSGL
jgi:hypothetical protein